jgi:hypothetical protein
MIWDRVKLARALYEMFEMRTSADWDEIGVEFRYPEMQNEWLKAADELILKMDEP